MVSLNEKCATLLAIAQQQVKEVEKEIPFVYRGMVKSLLTTLSMLVVVTPETKIGSMFEKVHMLYEAMTCDHQTSDDFKQHIEELLKAWT